MRKLVPSKAVLKALLDLPSKQYRQVVSAIFDLLDDPAPHYSKPLKGTAYWCTSVGEYRVIYLANDEAVHIAAVGKRNDSEVYKLLERKM